jgi:hypothetical protein
MHAVLARGRVPGAGGRGPGAGCWVLGRVRLCQVILTVTAVAAVACSEPSDGSGRPLPPQPDAKTVASKVNIDEIFPPGEGRDLVLNNCQNCHTFVPIVVLQMEEAAWTRNSIDHRERVTQLSDEDFKTLYAYLKANFHPGRPVPTLPKELLDTWTSY